MPRYAHRVWIASIAALAFLASSLDSRPAAADDDADVVVRKWLLLPTVEVVARRPLQPDAVFAKHLLARASPPPKDGDEIVGTLGKPAKWKTVEATKSDDPKKDAFVDGDGIGWAYASVESPADRVAIAKLEGAAVLFVGGAGFTGDVYRLGDVGVPVALKKGANDVYVGGARGAFRLTLRTPRAYCFDPSPPDLSMIYDLNRGVRPNRIEGGPELPQSMRFFNASNSPLPNRHRPDVVPLGTACLDPYENSAPTWTRAAEPGEPYRRTFISDIDGSVQSYALVPPSPAATGDKPASAPSNTDKTNIGLVLSLHGAGVECMDQAKAYAPKPDFWIVCPTNRGRFGFDWQDWGRLDAYEVLADALKVTGVDPRRVYLTGHSMGGHGTWHIAANDPDRFLAIAPSAGWCSFETYMPSSQATSPLAWMWRAADGASRTLDLVGNLARIPTYVLHGEKDDNVPASEARAMIDAITKAGGHPESHFEPDAGHWWDKDKDRPGADCVDWPGIWELFRKTQPAEKPATEIAFTTIDLSTWSEGDWLRIEQPIEYGRPSRIVAKLESGTLRITTDNVRLLLAKPEIRGLRKRDDPLPVWIDGIQVDRPIGTYVRSNGAWAAAYPLGETHTGLVAAVERQREKGYRSSSGPFKQAFTNRFVLVYGTAGDEAENRELLEKARYDSEVWAYRANGDANLMSDAQFLAGDFKDRNVIVYGNADTNKAWSAVFDDDCPIVAKRGALTVGGVKHEGVVAAAFVRPRKGSAVALAAAFADTGAAATRLFYSFPVFGSGVGIPDYVVFGPGYLKEMDGDVRAAGWFDFAWRMK
jgi:dienelactone hydrolase